MCSFRLHQAGAAATTKTIGPRRARRRRIIVTSLLLLLLLGFGDYWLYPLLAPVGGQNLDRGKNGIWLHYSWYFGQHSDGEIRQLASRLDQNHIRYAYCWVRYIKQDGTLRYHYPQEARHFIAMMHQQSPTLKVMAWIYAGNSRGAGKVDLADLKVRQTMIGQAQWLTQTCGFDGVQWDYEICEDGNPQLLSLLQETRAALPKGKLLSIATPMWLPAPLHQWGWSDAYFTQIARHCDQVAVMCYDSGLYLPRSYVWLMRQQAIHITPDVARGNARGEVIFGVPTYRKGGLSHHYHAENLYLALKGVREGMADTRANASVFGGVAPFADYTTQPTDWDTYRQWWLSRG